MKNTLTLSFTFLLIILIITGCSKINTTDSNQNTLPSEETTVTEPPIVTIEPTSTVSPTLTIPPTVTTSPDHTIKVTETPSSSELQAEEILKSMTLEEKIGQLFFVRCNNENALSDIETYHLGGYILFTDDFKDKSMIELKATLNTYQEKSKIPLLIGVDEEGGTVNRISKFTTFRSVPFKSPQTLYQEGGFDLIINDTIDKAHFLKSLGINVNLAPVCDVSTNPEDFIFNRSFGKNVKETSKYVKTVVSEMVSQNIGCTLKHFPGYGNNVDTHTGISVDKRSFESFLKSDFIPFEAGIDAGAGSILVSHNIVMSMDENFPASLSLPIHQILRDELGFEGVIMTDDLDMDAIKQYTNDEEAAVIAISAGNDMIIATNFDVQIPAVLAAVNDELISLERIDESVKRVLIWKISLGLISN